jgi:hypothetical protein
MKRSSDSKRQNSHDADVHKKQRANKKNHPIVRERKIKIVTQMKYLGVTPDSKLDW